MEVLSFTAGAAAAAAGMVLLGKAPKLQSPGQRALLERMAALERVHNELVAKRGPVIDEYISRTQAVERRVLELEKAACAPPQWAEQVNAMLEEQQARIETLSKRSTGTKIAEEARDLACKALSLSGKLDESISQPLLELSGKVAAHGSQLEVLSRILEPINNRYNNMEQTMDAIKASVDQAHKVGIVNGSDIAQMKAIVSQAVRMPAFAPPRGASPPAAAPIDPALQEAYRSEFLRRRGESAQAMPEGGL